MSPQFVDFDADGRLDIVAGIFDGSPHLVRGTEAGWGQPEQILDKEGNRIVGNAFWNFETKQWEDTTRYDAPGHDQKAHITSAVAFDWDGDGDLDLLLGDHSTGRVFRRTNEGTSAKPLFSLVNELVHASGKPIDVPGTVATMRVLDWNGDGLLDLACGSMGDSYGDGAGGGVYMFLNTGSATAPAFAAPLTFLPASKKGTKEAVRPDSGLYMDFGDQDGDGDLDMVVGGYAHWTPVPPELTDEQEALAASLRAELAELETETKAIFERLNEGTEGLDEKAVIALQEERMKTLSPALNEINQRRSKLMTKLDPLVPGPKRKSNVWFYENVTVRAN